MSHCAIAGREPGTDFGGIVVERTHAAAIGDAAGFVDDVEALGPRGIGIVGGIAHVIDSEIHRVVEPVNEIVGDGHALGQRFRLRITNVILDVRAHFPFIRWMSFAHINSEEVGVILVVVIELNHVADVAPKGRSSVAAEDEYERARAGSFANVKVRSAVQR